MPRRHFQPKKQSNMRPAKRTTNCKVVNNCEELLSFIVKDIFAGVCPNLEIGERNIHAWPAPKNPNNYKSFHRMSLKNAFSGKYHKLLLTAPPA